MRVAAGGQSPASGRAGNGSGRQPVRFALLRALLLTLIAILVDQESDLAARPVKRSGHRAMLAALFARRAALQDQIATIRRAEKAAPEAPPGLTDDRIELAVAALRRAIALARQGRAPMAADLAVIALRRMLAALRRPGD